MTDSKDTKKGTLSLGGTLSVSGGGNSQGAGVSVEVRRRRFGADTGGNTTAHSADSEMARRMKVLEEARKNEQLEKDRREADLKKASELQSKQVAALEERRQKEEEDRKRLVEEEARRKKEAEEKELAKQQAAASSREDANARHKADDASRKTLTLGDNYKKASSKPAAKDASKKRGRNAYMEELEQRYRSMPSRRKERVSGTGEGREDNRPAEKVIREVEIPDFITVQELASRMTEKGSDVVKKLMMMGEMVTLTQTLDQETALLIVEEFGHTYKTVSEADIEEGLVEDEDAAKDLKSRPPVVTVMGHVDHGKTTLLDSLRKARVAAGEAGGITQHIGAYQVELDGKGKITFLDTPGHAAFTAMRARGAQTTDVVILVVAADDGVMPQTIEAIQHAKAAGVPIVVAINKMDKPDATPDRVKNELLSHELILEDFGGEVPSVPVSALKGDGLTELMEVVLLQAEMLDLKANPKRRADGVVVEAELDKGRGSVATVVVQRGTLKIGDILVAGSVWGRVRAMNDAQGQPVKEAGPSMPVEVLGLQGVPSAGDTFVVVEDDKRAKEVAEYRDQKNREAAQAARKLSLDSLFDRMAEVDKLELNVIVKGDVQGSVEAIRHTLSRLDTPQVKVNVLHGAVGVVTETDVNLAMASDAIICAFNVRADATARRIAEKEGVEVRYYSVIYNMIDDLKNAMAGLLAPDYEEEILGSSEVRMVFKISKRRIAGCLVTDGLVRRNAKARLLRDGTVVHDGVLSSIRREKDEVKEVKAGTECGMTFDKFDDIQEGDVIEVYQLNEVKKTFADLEAMMAEQEKAQSQAEEAKA
ncbi:MAG: translation initiation factor IF-2 [Alphaproteobacteria bacterium]|nr:translation initiation factor IF-2 [Alphaproteobacteria bacterium]